METVYVVLGVVAWALSLVFGLLVTTTTVTQDVPAGLQPQAGKSVSAVIPHPTTGPLAGGLAVAGGLCFVAAALSAGRRPEMPFEQVQKRATEPQDRQAGAFFDQLGGSDSPRT